jgi:general secretion pathway protein M
MSFEIVLTPLQKRIAAIALAAIPVLVLLGIAAGAMADWSEHHGRIAVLERERARYEQLAADLPRHALQISQIKASGAEQAFFPTAQVPKIAAQIQDTVAQAVKSAGGAVSQANVLTESDPDSPVVGVSEHVMFTCDIATLTRVLHRIAQASPLLFVERLAIDDAGEGDAPTGPHRLNIDMIVAGYMRVS